MQVLSEERHYEALKAQPGPIRVYNEKADRTKLPGNYSYSFDEPGIEQMLDVRLTDRVEASTGRLVPCTRTWIQQELERLEKDWDRYNSAQPNPKPDMTGKWLNRRNYLRAKRRLMEEECRFLHKLLEEVQAKNKAKRESRKKVGCVKLKDGQPFRVDGRDLIQREDGEYVVKDSGQLLGDYIKEAKAKRKKAVQRKQQRAAARCAAC